MEGELTLLVRVLEGPRGRRAVLPRLRAQVVVEAGAGGHGLGVEVGREGAILAIHTMSYIRTNKHSQFFQGICMSGQKFPPHRSEHAPQSIKFTKNRLNDRLQVGCIVK